MDLRRVLDGAQRDGAGVDIELGRRPVDVGHEPALERLVEPGAGDQPGALGRRDGVDPLQGAAHVFGREHLPFDQQLDDRFRHHLVAGEGGVLEVRLEGVGVGMVAHFCSPAGSSQCS